MLIYDKNGNKVQYDVSKANPQCGVRLRDRVEGCDLGCDDFACCQNSENGNAPDNCLVQMCRLLGRDPEDGEDCTYCGMGR